MRVIEARNVNDAYREGLEFLTRYGVVQESRAGDVLVAPFPVTTMYHKPMERVLFDETRDANPFFHLMESLWMLAGKNDARWLDKFVSNFSERFAEDDGLQHGAYGFRWRNHFMLDGSVEDLNWGFELDQLERIITLLKNNPNDRRVVLQMWDPEIDLGQPKRDVPCNLCVLPRIVNNALDITVFCRSNDIIWGAYGANAVHFSVLQEYLAARIGVHIGHYYQVSNNYHAYLSIFTKKSNSLLKSNLWLNPYMFDEVVRVTPIVTHPEAFDEDLACFFNDPDNPPTKQEEYINPFFHQIAVPMFYAYKAWRDKDNKAMEDWFKLMPKYSDWHVACRHWVSRRKIKSESVGMNTASEANNAASQ